MYSITLNSNKNLNIIGDLKEVNVIIKDSIEKELYNGKLEINTMLDLSKIKMIYPITIEFSNCENVIDFRNTDIVNVDYIINDNQPIDVFSGCIYLQTVTYNSIINIMNRPNKTGMFRNCQSFDLRRNKGLVEKLIFNTSNLTEMFMNTTGEFIDWNNPNPIINCTRTFSKSDLVTITGLKLSNYDKSSIFTEMFTDCIEFQQVPPDMFKANKCENIDNIFLGSKNILINANFFNNANSLVDLELKHLFSDEIYKKLHHWK